MGPPGSAPATSSAPGESPSSKLNARMQWPPSRRGARTHGPPDGPESTRPAQAPRPPPGRERFEGSPGPVGTRRTTQATPRPPWTRSVRRCFRVSSRLTVLVQKASLILRFSIPDVRACGRVCEFGDRMGMHLAVPSQTSGGAGGVQSDRTPDAAPPHRAQSGRPCRLFPPLHRRPLFHPRLLPPLGLISASRHT